MRRARQEGPGRPGGVRGAGRAKEGQGRTGDQRGDQITRKGSLLALQRVGGRSLLVSSVYN